MWRVDLQVDGLSIDALVVSRDACRLILNLPFDVGKVVESSTGDMMKLCPFPLSGHARRRMKNVHLVIGGFAVPLGGDVDQLKDERPSSDDATTAWQEIPSDDIL